MSDEMHSESESALFASSASSEEHCSEVKDRDFACALFAKCEEHTGFSTLRMSSVQGSLHSKHISNNGTLEGRW